jgi:DNA polymerase-3 subunit alpha
MMMDGITFTKKAIRYGAKFKENKNSSQVSLFGESSDVQIEEPVGATCEGGARWRNCKRKKWLGYIYLASTG